MRTTMAVSLGTIALTMAWSAGCGGATSPDIGGNTGGAGGSPGAGGATSGTGGTAAGKGGAATGTGGSGTGTVGAGGAVVGSGGAAAAGASAGSAGMGAGGAGGTGASGASGATATVGGAGGGAPIACNDCVANQCTSQVAACQASKACDAELTCITTKCTGASPPPGCVMSCLQGGGKGGMQVFTVLQCASVSCGASCPALGGGKGQGGGPPGAGGGPPGAGGGPAGAGGTG